MHPSTRNRIGAIALAAGAFLGLMACNQSTEPNYREGWGAKGSLGSSGSSGSNSTEIARALVGSWRQTDSKGYELGYGDTTTFDARGGFVYIRHPPALKSQTFREEKGTYSTSGDTLVISRNSIRESYDGKQWVDYSPRKNTYTFVASGSSLTITDVFGEDFHFTR